MADLERLHDDLRYVRASVSGSAPAAPGTVYFLWAAIVLVGFLLPDFRPSWIPLYWTIAAPIGALISGLLGWRHQKAVGHVDATAGARHSLHWAALIVVVFLGGLMIQRSALSGETFGAVVLLLTAQAYFHAGIHLDPPLRWVALLMAVGYIIVLTSPSYAWTIVGVTVSLALVWAGLKGQRGRELAR